jgi:hypothetical protein
MTHIIKPMYFIFTQLGLLITKKYKIHCFYVLHVYFILLLVKVIKLILINYTKIKAFFVGVFRKKDIYEISTNDDKCFIKKLILILILIYINVYCK